MNKSVLVRLRGDNGDLNRALLGSAAAAKVLKRDLDDADDSGRRLSSALETSNDRTTMLIQGALALGPAFVPLGAQAVPVIAGITTQLGFAAAAAGTTALAFWGVGDALKAVNDYAIDPTDAHLKKMQETLATLGPEGQHFVHFLQDLRPEMQELQNLAQMGMLPGVEDGIESLIQRMPQFERIIVTISRTLGELSADAGESLGGPEWDEFFGFIQNEAQPIISEMSRSFGNFLLGMANMVEAFGPMSADFSGSLLSMSRDFVQWSDDLENSRGFQDFAEYLDRTGPKVWDTLGALSEALLAILEAAAPVGEVSLPIITALAKILALIAESPAGPVLVGAAAGFSAVSRAVALYKAANGSALLGMLSGASKDGARAGAGLRVAGAGAAALLFTMTDLDEQMGLSNAAMGAMLGMVAGPWGVAIGGGIGLVKDFAASNNDAAESAERWHKALEGTGFSFSDFAAELKAAKKNVDDLEDQFIAGNFGEQLLKGLNPQNIKFNLQALYGDLDESDLGRAAANYMELADANEAVTLAVNALGREFGVFKTGTYVDDVDRLGRVLERAQPAMDALGISTEDLMRAVDDGSINDLVNQIVEYTHWSESAAGRTVRIAEAMAGLDDELQSTEQSATELKSALDALLDPNLNLVRATDAWTTALRSLDGDLDKNSKTLRGNSNAAIQNREAINTRVDAMKELLGAEADAGQSGRKLSRDLRDQRKALIDAAVAAGIGRDEMRSYLNQLGLTPKLVRTLIEARTDQALAAIRKVRAEMATIKDKTVRLTYYVTQVNAINKRAGGGMDGDPSTPYAGGGWTGPYPVDKAVGVVHGDEHVTRASSRRRLEAAKPGALDYMNLTGQWPGYAAGGRVAPRYEQPRYAGSSYAPPAVSLDGARISGTLTLSGDGRTGHLDGHIVEIASEVARAEIRADRRFDRVRNGG